MPRYFFHFRSPHKTLPDREGTVLADADTARQNATLSVQDFFQPSTGCIDPAWEDWSIDVRDESGRCVIALAIADGGHLKNLDPPQGNDARASPGVVYLDVVRARRELRSQANQLHEQLRRTRALVDHHCYAANCFYQSLRSVQQAQRRSRELLARSRQQAFLSWEVWPEASGNQMFAHAVAEQQSRR